MKKINYILFTFIATLLLSSCKSDTSKNNSMNHDYTTVSVNIEHNSIKLSELFESIKPVYMETNASSLIGAYPTLSFTDQLVFIKTDNTIKQFDYDGNHLRTLDKKGSGGDEYIGISDFYVNEKFERIEILDKRQKKMLYYNYDGEFLDNLELGYWASKIIRDSDNRLYTYSGYDRDEDNIYKINMIDNKTHHAFHEIDEQKSAYLHILNPINFHKNDKEEILFFEPFNDTIFTLSKQNIEAKYVISYNGHNVPQSFYTQNEFTNVFEFFQEFNKHDYVNSPYNVIESANNLLFTCRKGSEKYLVLHNKKENNTHTYNTVVDDFFSTGIELPLQDEEFLFFAENNTILFFLQPYWLMEHKNKIVSQDLKMMTEKLDEEDNPIIMMAKLK